MEKSNTKILWATKNVNLDIFQAIFENGREKLWKSIQMGGLEAQNPSLKLSFLS